MRLSFARNHDPVSRRGYAKKSMDSPVLGLVAYRTAFNQKKSFDHFTAPFPSRMNKDLFVSWQCLSRNPVGLAERLGLPGLCG